MDLAPAHAANGRHALRRQRGAWLNVGTDRRQGRPGASMALGLMLWIALLTGFILLSLQAPEGTAPVDRAESQTAQAE